MYMTYTSLQIVGDHGVVDTTAITGDHVIIPTDGVDQVRHSWFSSYQTVQ